MNTSFLRFQSAVPNRRDRYPGVFAMANGLAHEGLLGPEDWTWWRAMNDRTNALYPDPEVVSPGTHEPDANPGARSWFKVGCRPVLLETTREYLDLLDRYRVPWHELRTSRPGRIVYEDPDQVVAVPYDHEAWPLPAVDRTRA